MPESRIALSWSSGKDSAWTLHLLRAMPGVEVVALLSTFNQAANRVAMHAVRRELAEAQAERAGLPLWAIDLPWPCPNSVYEDLMAAACRRATDEGVTAIAFGDLFLEDVRAYRERQLQPTGLKPLFPVWKIPTRELAWEMIRTGVRAKVTCVDPGKLDRSFAGHDFDSAFLGDLPDSVDPCGENGEFHTCVVAGPMFSKPLAVKPAGRVERDGYAYCDLMLE